MLHTIPGQLLRATVLKRPSAHIKSPYVADIRLDTGELGLCHTPGLGCCGLVEAGRTIYVNKSKEGSKTAYTTQLAECTDEQGIHYVGIHPLVAQVAARGLLSRISAEAKWSQEVTINEHTRIDYVGVLPNGKKIYVEVKTAMVSTECTTPRTYRKSVFPEGYRKKITDTVSPRAVKHAETLTEFAKHEDTEQCVLLFILPRDDCLAGLDINQRDLQYRLAVEKAWRGGVKIRAFALTYNLDGSIELANETYTYV
jgi:DNA-binding sugar fermentation-stimulating protein